MTEKNVFPFWNFVLKQGLIYGLITIVIFTIFDLTGLSQTSVAWFGFLVPLVVLYVGMQERKKMQEGFLTTSEGFFTGFSTGMIGSAVSNIFTIAYYHVLLPERKQNMLNLARKQIEEKYPDMSDKDIDFAVSYSEYAFQPHILLLLGLLMSLIISSIIAGILAAILQKEKNPFE
ncbi:MAG: DUF4199 domain-containing protein [Bacteroidetes bacterium]|nr:MAG: DUF4199 domain-containing protein [Bacteroidota bacterium]TAG86423.1 MAG: DUF4199 domain-containing protein [Bacteroidota bacterium]